MLTGQANSALSFRKTLMLCMGHQVSCKPSVSRCPFVPLRRDEDQPKTVGNGIMASLLQESDVKRQRTGTMTRFAKIAIQRIILTNSCDSTDAEGEHDDLWLALWCNCATVYLKRIGAPPRLCNGFRRLQLTMASRPSRTFCQTFSACARYSSGLQRVSTRACYHKTTSCRSGQPSMPLQLRKGCSHKHGFLFSRCFLGLLDAVEEPKIVALKRARSWNARPACCSCEHAALAVCLVCGKADSALGTASFSAACGNLALDGGIALFLPDCIASHRGRSLGQVALRKSTRLLQKRWPGSERGMASYNSAQMKLNIVPRESMPRDFKDRSHIFRLRTFLVPISISIDGVLPN